MEVTARRSRGACRAAGRLGSGRCNLRTNTEYRRTTAVEQLLQQRTSVHMCPTENSKRNKHTREGKHTGSNKTRT